MPKLVRGELTEKIIACAIRVHKELGPGFLEQIYQNAFSIELGEQHLSHDTEPGVLVRYRGRVVGRHRLDVIVVEEVVVELKALEDISPTHMAITRSYLKATGLRVGLVINFGRSMIQVRRVVL